MRLATIVGARPQFIKAAPLSRAIAESNSSLGYGATQIDEVLIHTGQHYDVEMSGVFFESLGLKSPKYDLEVGSGTHGKQLSRMLERLEGVLQSEHPDAVLVYGDTNSTLAGALIADRLQIPVVHVEAGLRSFNRRMPEECNRVLTDHLSSLLFAPTQTAVDNLFREGIRKGVHLVGDVMYEVATTHGEIAERESTVLQRLKIDRKSYLLATIHRAENTDDQVRMSGIVRALLNLSESGPIVWPMHPRTRQRFSEDDLRRFSAGGLLIIPPVPYLDMLLLEKEASVILTDSGGVQKEAMWFQTPCVTLRDETEWIETVESGWNRLAGSCTSAICRAVDQARRDIPSPFNHDRSNSASKLIVNQLRVFASTEPDRHVVTG